MSKEDPYRDQAERLRQRIERMQEGSSKTEDLPPRSNVHRDKKKKTKLKVKYPIIRLLVLFFILLPLTIFSAYSYLEEKKDKGSQEVNGDVGGYEQIKYQEKNSEDSYKENVNKKNPDAEKDEALQEIEETLEPAEESAEDTISDTAAKPQSKPESKPLLKKTETNSSTGNVIYHKVQSQETLFRIAIKYYQSANGIEIIKKDNGITGNEIQAGQVLKGRAHRYM